MNWRREKQWKRLKLVLFEMINNGIMNNENTILNYQEEDYLHLYNLEKENFLKTSVNLLFEIY